MHILPGALRARLIFFSALFLCLAGPAAGGHDPLVSAKGIWQGEADNGREKFSVSVTVKKDGTVVFGACDARSAAATRVKADFKASLEGEGRKVAVKVRSDSLKAFGFDVFAKPLNGSQLAISSFMGEGTLSFLNDFLKAEFELRSVATGVKATLYRTYPPPPKKKSGAGKKPVQTPALPPLVIVR